MRRQDLDRKARAFALRKAGRPAPAPPDPLPRIEALTKNARTTWFSLLGVLVFVGVTLMGVEHIDFYGVNRATQLPLVNVSVPTRLFFLVAPVLTAAAFGYFHLYLIRLWDELGQAPARANGARLIGADLQRTSLDDTSLEGADLGYADLTGARLHRTRLIGATLDASLLAAPPRQVNVLAETRLDATRNAGGALRRVDLRAAVVDTSTDFRNAFLDGSVLMTSGFRRQMGPPCQWTDEVLDDRAFYGRWRAWLARAPVPVNWETLAPEEWRDVPPLPLDPSCRWKTDPMPAAARPAQD